MTITTSSIPLVTYAATDAGFRIWAKAWHDAMIALGCAQEYSNIDFTTVAMPTVTNTLAGGRVYTFGDTLQATDPIFIKLEWGRGSTSQAHTSFILKMTVGQAHASGTVSGNSINEYLATWNAIPDDGELVITRTDAGISVWGNLPLGSYKFAPGFTIERVCLNGTPTGDGIAWTIFGTDVAGYTTQTGDIRLGSVNYVLGVDYGKGVGFSPPIAASESVDPSFDDKAPVFPIYTFGGYDPLTNMIAASKAYLNGQRFTANVNGTSGQYRTLPGSGPNLGSNSPMTALRVA